MSEFLWYVYIFADIVYIDGNLMQFHDTASTQSFGMSPQLSSHLVGPEHFLSHEYYLQYQQSLNVGITRRRADSILLALVGLVQKCGIDWSPAKATYFNR